MENNKKQRMINSLIMLVIIGMFLAAITCLSEHSGVVFARNSTKVSPAEQQLDKTLRHIEKNEYSLAIDTCQEV